jgi:trehalose 6-phosphate phosphatase
VLGDSLLERRTAENADDGRQPDEHRRARLDLAVEGVRRGTRNRRDEDRRERRARGASLVEREQEDEQRHDHETTTDAEEGAEEPRNEAGAEKFRHRHCAYCTSVDALSLLAAEPALGALFLDVDGVLAPIVARPEDARVPPATRAELARLAGRYGLVACVTGRTAAFAREIVGVESLRYVGEHGLELDPAAREWAPRIHSFAAGVDWPEIEPKPLSVAFHFRGAADQAAARRQLEGVATRALVEGFRPRWGRMVLEVLPPLDVSKGTAVRHLLGESGLQRALYAGDDVTDLDGFAALDGLEAAVRVAVVSSEGPSKLGERADMIVGSTGAFAELLRRL